MEVIQKVQEVFLKHKVLALMLIIFIVLLVACLFTRNCLLSAQKRKEKGVREEGFENSKPTVCLHYVSWCGHCKNVKPHFESLMQDPEVLEAANVQLIDCEGSGEEACRAKKISSFPTITRTNSSGEEVEYQGERSFEALKQFCMQG